MSFVSPMDAERRLRRVRGELTLAMMVRAACLLLLAAVSGQVVNFWWQGDEAVPRGFLLTGALTMVGWGVLARRASRLRDLRTVALWIEHRVPALRYALVTRLDTAGEQARRALDAAVATVQFERLVRWHVWRPALLFVAAAIGAIALERVVLTTGRPSDPSRSPLVRYSGPARRIAAAADALSRVRITITPPGYSGQSARQLDDPSRVEGLVGSAVLVTGAQGDAPVSAQVNRDLVAATTSTDRWSVALRMPSAPTVVTLVSGARRRAVLLEPITDSIPAVTLELPARDTVVRVASGRIALVAEARDDIGLRDAWFEVVVSAGEGENFTFRTTTLARRTVGSRAATLRALLSLDSLALAPGDLVHVRAVARDGNTVTGPGLGGSDTRAIRVARADEYDSVAVEGAPPPDALKGILSQRLLIQLAEALEKRRRTLARDPFVGESRKIARDQNALRRQVGDIIFQRLEDLGGGGEHSHDDGHDHGQLTPEQLLAEAREATSHAGEALDFAGGESPVVAINRPLLEAYNAMWEAGSELGVGEPRRALPHMRAALEAIQRARAAERIYLRGRPKELVVDIAKVRLAGKTDRIGPAARTPRDSEDAATRARLARFDRAVTQLAASREAAIAELLLLRAELLGSARGVTDALGQAADALRAGTDATDALVRSRRALAGAPVVVQPIGAWSRTP